MYLKLIGTIILFLILSGCFGEKLDSHSDSIIGIERLDYLDQKKISVPDGFIVYWSEAYIDWEENTYVLVSDESWNDLHVMINQEVFKVGQAFAGADGMIENVSLVDNIFSFSYAQNEWTEEEHKKSEESGRCYNTLASEKFSGLRNFGDDGGKIGGQEKEYMRRDSICRNMYPLEKWHRETFVFDTTELK